MKQLDDDKEESKMNEEEAKQTHDVYTYNEKP